MSDTTESDPVIRSVMVNGDIAVIAGNIAEPRDHDVKSSCHFSTQHSNDAMIRCQVVTRFYNFATLVCAGAGGVASHHAERPFCIQTRGLDDRSIPFYYLVRW